MDKEHYAFAIKQAEYHYNRNKTIPLDDLIQIATLTVEKIISKYNPEKGTFETYASTAIRNAFKDILDKELKESHNELVDNVYVELKYDALNYDLLTQDELELWEDFNTSKMNVKQYSEYYNIPYTTLCNKLNSIKHKLTTKPTDEIKKNQKKFMF